MGRLFWTLLLIIWLAQIASVFGVGTAIWLKHRALGEGGPPPHHHPELPPHSHDHPPPPHSHPRNGPPLAFPVEPMIVGTLVSLGAAILLARYLSKPIRLLKQGFDAVAEGNLQLRLEPAIGKRRDELADLGRQYDQVVMRLQASVEGQRRLFHQVSHELRSPLARLQVALDLAKQQPEVQEKWLQRIDVEAGRMDRLVGELLTLARIEAGMVSAQKEAFDLVDLLAAVVDDARFEAQGAGKDVLLSAPASLPVQGDPELLQRAIENVVRNAVRYTVEGSAVQVRADLDRAVVRIAVTDQGPGIAAQDLTSIFDPFQRGGGKSQGEGYGLGLAIARQVLEAHRGFIVAENGAAGGLIVRMEWPSGLDSEG